MRRNIVTVAKLILAAGIVVTLVLLFNKSNSLARSSSPQTMKLINHPRHGSFFGGQPKNTQGKKIDWHDYKLIKAEESRKGIGEQGRAEKLDSSMKEMEDKLFHKNGFNALLSDKISLNRSVPDIRHPGCRDKSYLSELPTVSGNINAFFKVIKF